MTNGNRHFTSKRKQKKLWELKEGGGVNEMVKRNYVAVNNKEKVSESVGLPKGKQIGIIRQWLCERCDYEENWENSRHISIYVCTSSSIINEDEDSTKEERKGCTLWGFHDKNKNQQNTRRTMMHSCDANKKLRRITGQNELS